jgi:hypothetical protein
MRIPESYRDNLLLERRRRRRLFAALRARLHVSPQRRRQPRPYQRLIKHPQGALSPLYGGE